MTEKMPLESWQRTMVRCLFPYSAKRLRIEQAFMVKHPHVPAKLYKYRDFSNPYHRDGLEADQQWFSSPNNFNDPFDTVTKFQTDRLPQQRQTLEECLAEIEKIKNAEASGEKWVPPKITDPVCAQKWHAMIAEPLIEKLPAEQRQPMREFIQSWKRKMNAEMIDSISTFLRSGFSVLSLSANPTSNLMWSHYGASHTGFCIEYDFGSLPYSDLRKRLCFPVFYRNKRADISRYLAQPRDDYNNLVGNYLSLIKSSDWQYEKEWRIVHAIGPDHANRSYDMPKPSALIAGASVSDDDLKYARAFCEERKIPLQQALLSTEDMTVSLADHSK
ncbi:DUF2971 domain-containing protein [Aurantiacibacter sp. D1-12]|uniref:DUF2971 domain-containing protein n=1 Tax=Aurantiacibacter sp. D1-12 TaxID=2993658 RepID=UPI00237C627B|nr:DUF2971 domain-containing protein [Aurantiacibacter sp. D1-12]MDE1466911.1 DUF2971 domain-containing protein [Aurantiacibacter sp. D1-12]